MLEKAITVAEALGLKMGLLAPSLVGGLVALYFYDEPPADGRCMRCRKALVVALGTGLGLFCAPLIVEGFGLTDSKGRLEIGFAVLIAALGMAVLAAIQRGLRETAWGKAIESWITRR